MNIPKPVAVLLVAAAIGGGVAARHPEPAPHVAIAAGEPAAEPPAPEALVPPTAPSPEPGLDDSQPGPGQNRSRPRPPVTTATLPAGVEVGFPVTSAPTTEAAPTATPPGLPAETPSTTEAPTAQPDPPGASPGTTAPAPSTTTTTAGAPATTTTTAPRQWVEVARWPMRDWDGIDTINLTLETGTLRFHDEGSGRGNGRAQIFIDDDPARYASGDCPAGTYLWTSFYGCYPKTDAGYITTAERTVGPGPHAFTIRLYPNATPGSTGYAVVEELR